MLARDIQHDLARPDLPADIADRIARVLAPVQTLVRSHPRWHDAACQANCLQQAISCRGEGESLCAEVADWAARWIALNPHLTSIGNFLFKQRRSEAGRELPLALRERVGVRADGERAGRRKDVLESATPQPNLLLEGEGDLARVKELNRKILWAEIALGICARGRCLRSSAWIPRMFAISAAGTATRGFNRTSATPTSIPGASTRLPTACRPSPS